MANSTDAGTLVLFLSCFMVYGIRALEIFLTYSLVYLALAVQIIAQTDNMRKFIFNCSSFYLE